MQVLDELLKASLTLKHKRWRKKREGNVSPTFSVIFDSENARHPTGRKKKKRCLEIIKDSEF